MSRPTTRLANAGGLVLIVSIAFGALALDDGIPPNAHTPFDAGRASFAIALDDDEIPYGVFASYVLPGSTTRIEVRDGKPDETYRLDVASGVVSSVGPSIWEWTAPDEPGLYPMDVVRRAPADTIHVNAFVMVPRERMRDGFLNGYRVGAYPSTPLRNLPIYQPPTGFVEIDATLIDTPVSPHFTLGQFLCKQEADHPKYVLLEERLLLKLELILAQVNDRGIRCDSFTVMSGYRTPFHNHAIGNVTYSRHVWGDAADVYIDVNPVDGIMDDLNGDGRFDIRDARVLYGIIDDLYGRPFYARLVGGLGQYRRTSAHGPFVHVDVRGFRARWGN